MISITDKIKTIKEKFGEQKNLLLLDNNVLASENFEDIIKEIKKAGFYKGASFVQPNYLDLAIKCIKQNYNKDAYIKKAAILLLEFLDKLQGNSKQELFDTLKEHYLLNKYTATEQDVMEVYKKYKDLYEQKRIKKPKNRYIDFNQGLDARLLTDEKMKLLSEIAINPLRIAFDNWQKKDVYENAVKLAAKHNIVHLSNYILYNFEDKPIELYNRLKINVMLSDELNVRIYSFPMKYHPIMDPKYFQNREFIGKHWNRKFIRAVQAVLNATKGKIGTGQSFFDEAFGRDENEFNKILLMPETFIIYRMKFKETLTKQWWNDYNDLNEEEKEITNNVIYSNNFNNINLYKSNKKIYKVLKYYTIERESVVKDLVCV